ncbi:MAG: hypothetical protein MO846_11095 [Candidatus Devosia symbiotica]|nr:hypothetical protein [Candidatus Devosia symbiotica]
MLRASTSEIEAARAVADLQSTSKLIVAKNGAILGGAMLGASAGDTVAMLVLALDRGMSAADLASLLLSASAAAPLVKLGRQFVAHHRPSAGAKRLAALRRMLP